MSSSEEYFVQVVAQKRGALWKLRKLISEDDLAKLLLDDTFCSSAKSKAVEEVAYALMRPLSLETVCWVSIRAADSNQSLRNWYYDLIGAASDVLVTKFNQLTVPYKQAFFRRMCKQRFPADSAKLQSQAILLQRLSENMRWPARLKPMAWILINLQIGTDPAADAEHIVASYRLLLHLLPPE